MLRATKMLWKTQVTVQVFVFSEFAAKFTKKNTEHFFTILYVYNICYVNIRTHLNDLVIIGGRGDVKHAIADKLQKIGT